eukprot:5624467-Pleurochrysis_carterae.AAC.2
MGACAIMKGGVVHSPTWTLGQPLHICEGAHSTSIPPHGTLVPPASTPSSPVWPSLSLPLTPAQTAHAYPTPCASLNSMP